MAAPTFDQVNADYKKYLQRDLTQAEYTKYYAPLTDYNPGMVANSQEALAIANKQVPGTPGYDPRGGQVASGNLTGQQDANGKPLGGNLKDPKYAEALVSYFANQPGANPSLKNDPNYWITRMGQVGGDQGYWEGRFMQPEGTPDPSQPPGTNTPGATPNPLGDPNALATYMTDSPLLKPWTVPFSYPDWQAPAAFTAPTDVTEQNDPGYQFRAQQGQQAIDRSAAARGTLLTGGTLKDLEQFGQDYGSGEYQNVYNRALQNYTTDYNSSLTDWTTNYNKASQGYAQAYNIFSNNQSNQYNRIANLAGLGQVAASQLGSQGLGYAGLNASTLQNGASSLGNLYTQGANAGAAGIAGVTNAGLSALYGALNSKSLYGNGNGGYTGGQGGVPE